MLWMLRPVERSITVSPPQRIAHTSFSTSSAAPDVTAELPILALIFTRKLRPMMTGSSSGWLMLAGMMARPRAISLADEFRRDEVGNLRAEVLAVGATFGRAFQRLRAAEVLAMRDVDHFFGDDAGAGEFKLRDELTGLAAIDRMLGRAGGHQLVAGDAAIVLGLHRAGGDALEAALGDPVAAQRRQAGFQVDRDRRIGVGAGGVVGAIGFLACASDPARSRGTARMMSGRPSGEV